MGKVLFEISMSLDGYVAGPNDGPQLGLGEGGEQLHEWVVKLETWREKHGMEGGERNQDDEIVQETVNSHGAGIIGRRMFDIAFDLWGDTPPFQMPIYVITHRPRPPIPMQGGTTYHFVTSLEDAVRQAREAAGDKNVSISGGANIANQLINAGLVDEFRIHLVPIFLGGGVRLFENMDPNIKLTASRVVHSPEVTHLMFDVNKR